MAGELVYELIDNLKTKLLTYGYEGVSGGWLKNTNIFDCLGESMKKTELKMVLGILFIGGVTSLCSARSVNNPINRPSRVEAAAGEHTSQVVIEFLHPVYFEKKEVKPGEMVELSFPGVSLEDFAKLGIVQKFKSLTVIKNASIRVEKFPIPRVVLLMSFEPNDVLVRLTKMEDPNLLVIDIFYKEILEKLRRKQTTTLYACNNVVLSDSIGLAKKKRVSNPARVYDLVKARNARVVIDAGHGGEDNGACAFGLKEKDFTLAIARQMYVLLKKKGYRVFLTRNVDKTLSVVDRFELAQQLKADLFVSVHANAAIGMGNASGIETHFLDEAPFFLRGGKMQFMLVNDHHDKTLAIVANKFLKEKITVSKELSQQIQSSLLDRLKKGNIDVVDRGVKRTGFRTLLRHEVPASIVEVGFITNKKEAKRLAQSWYRRVIAQGICCGI